MKVAPVQKEVLVPPLHVAIIMDGNGRWAMRRGLPRTAGHKRGAEAVKVTVEAAVELGISCLTLFGFSSENWKRPSAEINDLMGLLRFYLRTELEFLHRNGVRLQIIGDRRRLPSDIVEMIQAAEVQTADNGMLNLVIALNYGGRSEIVNAAHAIAEAVRAGTVAPEDVDEDLFAGHLFTADIPDPDLLIRTSGEQRISNFLLWQLAYTEFVFLDTLWPDFSREDLEQAIELYLGRERRYGAAGG